MAAYRWGSDSGLQAGAAGAEAQRVVSPRERLKQQLVGLTYEQQVALVRPPVPMSAAPAEASAVVQRQEDGTARSAPEGDAALATRGGTSPGSGEAITLALRLATAYDELQLTHNSLVGCFARAAARADQWTGLFEAAGAAHARAQGRFDETMAAQQRADRAAVEVLMSVLGVAAGGLWTYVDSVGGVSDRLSELGRILGDAARLSLSERQLAVAEAVGFVAGEAGDALFEAAGEAASEHVRDTLLPSTTGRPNEMTETYRSRLMNRLLDAHVGIVTPLATEMERIVRVQQMAIWDRHVLDEMATRRTAAEPAVVRLVAAWEGLAGQMRESVASLIQALEASPLMHEPPELPLLALAYGLERGLWADWLRGHLEQGPAVSCPADFAQPGVDVPPGSRAGGDRCEMRPRFSPLGQHIDSRLTELGIPVPSRDGNEETLAWARSYQPRVLL